MYNQRTTGIGNTTTLYKVQPILAAIEIPTLPYIMDKPNHYVDIPTLLYLTNC